jgi:hypothetical protein
MSRSRNGEDRTDYREAGCHSLHGSASVPALDPGTAHPRGTIPPEVGGSGNLRVNS